MDTDLTLLKTQMNLIRLSKVIKNPLHLKQKTGINMYNINYVLQNQSEILQKWKEHVNKKPLYCTQSDDWSGIDILLLEWVARCKLLGIKLTTSSIKAQVMNLAGFMKISSYYIKANIWAQIEEILNDESITVEPINSGSPKTLLHLLENDGSRLLKPQTYKRFLKMTNVVRMRENANNSETNNISTNQVTILNNTANISHGTESTKKGKSKRIKVKSNILPSKKKTNVTSAPSVEFPPLLAINLTFKDENLELLVKNEPLEYTADTSNTNVLRSVVIKEEIIDDFNDEQQNELENFLCISEDERTAGSIVYKFPQDVYEEIKQEPEYIVDECETHINKIIESDREDGQGKTEQVCEYPLAKCEKIKQEPGLIVNDQANSPEKFETVDNNDRAEMNLHDLHKNLKISNKNFEMQSNDQCYQEIETKISDTNAEENDVEIVFELDESDDDFKNELIEVINKYTNMNHKNFKEESHISVKTEIKQEILKQNESDEEVLTVLEILSDDDEGDNNKIQDLELQELFKKHSTQTYTQHTRQSLKRTRKKIKENPPSVLQTNILNTPTTSALLNKRHCGTELTDLANLSVRSNVEAFKYLHCIKKYFQSQNDEVASKLVSELMMSFMICCETLEK